MSDAPESPPPDETPKPHPNLGRKHPKRRAPMDRATYDRVLAAYRETPANHSAASRYALYDRIACRRLWDEGWPRFGWARPIKQVIQEDAERARGEALIRIQKERELQDADREKKRKAFAAAIEEETTMMAAVRKNVMGAAAIANSMQQGMLRISKLVLSAVQDADGNLLATPLISPMQAMAVLRSYTTMVGRLSAAEQIVVELGKLDRGEQPVVEAAAAEMDDRAILENLTLLSDIRKQMADELGEGAEPEDVEPVLQ